MNRICFDFFNGKIELDRNGQKGTERAPDLAECREKILAALGLPDQDIPKLTIDFEAGTMDPDLGVQSIQEKEMAVYAAAGYETTDFSNVAGIVEAYINGQIPEGLFSKMMDFEGTKNEADPDIKTFLEMLIPPQDDEK